MSSSHKILKVARQIHLYTGIFISPAILFFALTGALQTFSLHETSRGSDYKPPTWILTLAQLHRTTRYNFLQSIICVCCYITHNGMQPC